MIIAEAHEYRELAMFLKDKYPDLYEMNINKPMANLATEGFVVDPQDIREIAETLLNYDDFHQAEPLYRMLLDHYTDKKTITSLKKDLGECIFNIHQLDKTDDCSEVGTLWHSVVDYYMEHYGIENKDTVDVIVDLANYYAYINDYDTAVKYFNDIVSVHTNVPDINYPYFIFSFADLLKEMINANEKVFNHRRVLYDIGLVVFKEQPRLMSKLLQIISFSSA
jgi:tetratricopeptide (TPR) repeat protein